MAQSGLFDRRIDALAVQWNSMGLAVANAAKHKLVGLLIEKLGVDEITVGEVVVNGVVKSADGNGTVEPRTVANAFWEIYSQDQSRVVTVS